ncbi:MAG TPA: hypothetical protein ENN92_00750 [candidate division WWE3 bacterium]|uniref:RlpA-like protein double-psi beta-barrel domain-containing protein n=1 Tax=candidate division WWE3 bacterium TaxID=2053526 RepID=A0A7C1DM72_UNCKA|nr:hypothetical protein [candidate division WWE3 bacterium]
MTLIGWLIFQLIILLGCEEVKAEENIAYASWYSYESCRKEGTSGIYAASGERFNEDDYTFACWHLPFGTKVEFTNIRNNKKIVAICTDRGPAKRLVEKSRIFDLSKAAFAQIEDLNKGIVKVKWRVVKNQWERISKKKEVKNEKRVRIKESHRNRKPGYGGEK